MLLSKLSEGIFQYTGEDKEILGITSIPQKIREGDCFVMLRGVFKEKAYQIYEVINRRPAIILTEEKVNADIPRSSEYFSGGCVDQMYLSLRLALTDMLFKDKTIFMLLDQPFLQYDEKRKKNAMGLLDSLGEKRQIILFENDVERFSPNKNIEILT